MHSQLCKNKYSKILNFRNLLQIQETTKTTPFDRRPHKKKEAHIIWYLSIIFEHSNDNVLWPGLYTQSSLTSLMEISRNTHWIYFLSHFQFLALVEYLKSGRKPKGVAWETAFANDAVSQMLAFIPFSKHLRGFAFPLPPKNPLQVISKTYPE